MKNRLFNLIFINCFFTLLILQCAGTPHDSFQTAEKFLDLRTNDHWFEQYQLFHENFKRDVPADRYSGLENLYKNKFGMLKQYKLKKWNERKNFSCGKGSGRMVALIYNCFYEKGTTEETFTMIKSKGRWEIFDYYLRPL